MNTPNRSSLSKQEIAYNLLDGVTNPQSFSCRVLWYFRSHSQLYIKAESLASPESHPLILAFESVYYFEGPMMWHGLDFRLGSLKERISLLQAGWIDVGQWLEKFAEEQLLFVLERPKYRVQIVASSFHIDTNEPNIRLVHSDTAQNSQE